LQWLGAEALEAGQQVRQVEREIERRVEHDPLLLPLAAVIGKVSPTSAARRYGRA
jgi:hypothetical protein